MLGELARQLTWTEACATLNHYRNGDDQEVDAVIEHHDGRVLGIEAKASSTVNIDDFRHLAHLRCRTGEQLHRGVVLYAGTEVLPFGDRMIAAPIDALWQSG